MSDDHLARLTSALDKFERKLVERWQQKVHDCVLSGDTIPRNLHRSGLTGYLDDKNTVPNHQLPEVRAHVTYGVEFGGCAYINWHEAGRNGDIGSVTCDGTIREDPGDAEKSVWWIGDQPVDVPERIDCPVGEIFQAAQDWAWQDRTDIFYTLPRFADQDLAVIEDAFNALTGMAGDFGATRPRGADGVRFQTDRELTPRVNWLSDAENAEKSWRLQWTGTAADWVADGIFASTLPTMVNHSLLAAGLAQLINMRASIIKQYRKNSIELIEAATQALGQTSQDTTDFGPLWQTVDFAGMITGLIPQTAAASGPLSLVAFLGDQFLSSSGTEVSYTHEPEKVAIALYDDIRAMNERLARAEADYEDEVNQFRNGVNEVPSTHLELYDLTENSPTEVH
jgi:uncharacterized protein (DUF2062 family)